MLCLDAMMTIGIVHAMISNVLVWDNTIKIHFLQSDNNSPVSVDIFYEPNSSDGSDWNFGEISRGWMVTVSSLVLERDGKDNILNMSLGPSDNMPPLICYISYAPNTKMIMTTMRMLPLEELTLKELTLYSLFKDLIVSVSFSPRLVLTSQNVCGSIVYVLEVFLP
jgi:hypothetical protein